MHQTPSVVRAARRLLAASVLLFATAPGAVPAQSADGAEVQAIETREVLTQARAALRRSDGPSAERILRQAIDGGLDALPVQRLLADVLLQQGDLGALETLFQGLSRSHRTADPTLAVRWAQLRLLREGREAGLAAVNRALQVQPRSPALHAQKATVEMQFSRWPLAIAHGQRALALDPEGIDAAFDLIVAMLRAGDVRGAARYCGTLMDSRSRPGGYLALCVLLRPDRFEDWEIPLKLAIGTDPLFPVPLEVLRGLVHLQRAQIDQALPVLEAGPMVDDSLLRRYLHAQALLAIGRSDSARWKIQVLSPAYAQTEMFTRLRGEILVDEGEWRPALEALRAWTERHPQDTEALRLQERAAREVGDRSASNAVATALEQLRDRGGEPQSMLDRVLRLPGGMAVDQLSRILVLDRDRRAAALLLEQYPLPVARAATSLAALRRMLTREPAAPATRFYLALEWTRQGRHRAARSALLDALTARPDAPAVVMLRANARLQADDADAARDLLRWLVFRRPDHGGARDALGGLDTAENVERARLGLPLPEDAQPQQSDAFSAQ